MGTRRKKKSSLRGRGVAIAIASHLDHLALHERGVAVIAFIIIMFIGITVVIVISPPPRHPLFFALIRLLLHP